MSLNYCIEQLSNIDGLSDEQIARRTAVSTILQAALTALGEDVPLPQNTPPDPVAQPMMQSAGALVLRSEEYSDVLVSQSTLNEQVENSQKLSEQTHSITQPYAELAQTLLLNKGVNQAKGLFRRSGYKKKVIWEQSDILNGVHIDYCSVLELDTDRAIQRVKRWYIEAGAPGAVSYGHEKFESNNSSNLQVMASLDQGSVNTVTLQSSHGDYGELFLKDALPDNSTIRKIHFDLQGDNPVVQVTVAPGLVRKYIFDNSKNIFIDQNPIYKGELTVDKYLALLARTLSIYPTLPVTSILNS